MSIGRRFADLIRSNINSFFNSDSWQYRSNKDLSIEDLSDEELEAEIERRKKRRDAAKRAAAGTYKEEKENPRQDSNKQHYQKTNSPPKTGNSSPRFSSNKKDPKLARLYAQLECPYGANLITVRQRYRMLMRKYHPDMHTGRPDKQRLATELTQQLTTAYNELKQHLSK